MMTNQHQEGTITIAIADSEPLQPGKSLITEGKLDERVGRIGTGQGEQIK